MASPGAEKRPAWAREILPPPFGLEALPHRVALIALIVALGVWDGVATWVVWEASGDAERDIVHQICVQMLYWLYWLPLVPIVFATAARIRRSRLPDWATVLVHSVIATLLGCLHLVGMALVAWSGWNRASGTGTLGTNIAILLGNFFVYDFAIYAVVVVSYLVVVAVRGREEALVAEAALREDKLRAEMRSSEARLRALRMELNPHFLFNALNDLSALVRTRRPARAIRMITRLGALLRVTLERPTEPEIQLQEEVELLEMYVELEHMRFEDRLQVRIDIAPEATACLVPPSFLQPLVENAIRHGFTSSGLHVLVSAEREGDSLVVTVLDDGPGFEDGAPLGVGLTNLGERLEELYGDRGSLTLGNRDDGPTGARVTVTVPFSVT